MASLSCSCMRLEPWISGEAARIGLTQHALNSSEMKTRSMHAAYRGHRLKPSPTMRTGTEGDDAVLVSSPRFDVYDRASR